MRIVQNALGQASVTGMSEDLAMGVGWNGYLTCGCLTGLHSVGDG